jgi:hypothetical protein
MRPKTILAIAIGHFLVALLSLGLNPILGIVPWHSRSHIRAERAVRDAIAESLPGGTILHGAHLGIRLIVPVLLVASGVGLLRMKHWGRSLSYFYAGLSLLDNLAYGSFLGYVKWINDAALFNAMQREGVEANVVADVLLLEAFTVVLGIIYPLIILVALTRSSVSAATGVAIRMS